MHLAKLGVKLGDDGSINILDLLFFILKPYSENDCCLSFIYSGASNDTYAPYAKYTA